MKIYWKKYIFIKKPDILAKKDYSLYKILVFLI